MSESGYCLYYANQSYLAGIGIRSSLRVGFSSGGGDPGAMWDAVVGGLARGITNVSLQWGAQELGISPMIASLITSAGTGALEALLEGRNPLVGIYDTYFKAGTGLLTLGGPGATPWEQAVYISQVLDFSELVREQGIVEALETYATGFLHQNTLDNIWKLGGIYDLLMNQDQIEFVTQPDGTEAKRVYTDEGKNDYIELALDDDRLIGKKEGNIVMHCEFVKGPDGRFKLKNGDIDVYNEDETKIVRQDRIRDFKLTKVLKYDESGNLTDKIYQVDDGSIQLNSDGEVLHGKRENLVDDVTTYYKSGSVVRVELYRNYVLSDEERQVYIDQGYSAEQMRNFKQIHIYDAENLGNEVSTYIYDSNNTLIKETATNNKAKQVWEWAVKLMSSGNADTYITLDREKGVANVDMELTYPDALPSADILIQATELLGYLGHNNANWHTAAMDAAPEVGALIANNDAQFVYVAGVNDTGKSTDVLYEMKESLQTNKTIVVGHSAGTETSLRSTFVAQADKYIIASPRMKPEAFYAIMQEAGVSSDQIIIVSTKGDFWNWGGSYTDYAPANWTCVYIESGPGVDVLNPKSSHGVPIDGWISGGEYNVRINNGDLLEGKKLSDIYKEEVNK